MTPQEINQICSKYGLTYQDISQLCGLPVDSVQKVLGGITKNPEQDTVLTLAHVFEDLQKGQKFSHVWTATERDNLPAQRRTELIDGVLYDMAAPSPAHQLICKGICRQIDNCIEAHHAPCEAFLAPTDVYPDHSEYTVVQPDVFVVCDKGQITKQNIQGAPAFIVEVLSPATRKKDQTDKLKKYLESGVREYWTIDPERQHVVVYDMTGNHADTPPEEKGYQVALYGFQDTVPVIISEGKCVIDMNVIRMRLEELFTE